MQTNQYLKQLTKIIFGTFFTFVCSFSFANTYKHFGWEQVEPGVWFGFPLPNFFQGGNVAIITLPSGGSLVVDTQNSEFLGKEILDKAIELGKGPVKYVVNTHLHQDHMGGNIVFKEHNPSIQIFAHQNTCASAPFKTVLRMEDRLPGIFKGLNDAKTLRSSIADTDKMAPGLDRRILGTELYIADTKKFRWEMPNTCLDLKPGEKRIIEDGGRKIEIAYFGRGHTSGDLVVFLPKEKVIIVGDLWGSGSGHIHSDAGMDGREGSVLETPFTLKEIRKLDFETILTGHAAGPLKGKSSLDNAIALGEQTIRKVKEANARGVSIGPLLQKMPPPEKAPQFVIDGWVSVIVRTFEEIELRRMWGIPLPTEQNHHHH